MARATSVLAMTAAMLAMAGCGGANDGAAGEQDPGPAVTDAGSGGAAGHAGSATGGAGIGAGGGPSASGTGGPWIPVDGNGSRKAFYMFASPHVDRVLYWDSGQKKLFASTDKGQTWTALAAVSSGKTVDAMMQQAVWDPADPTDNTFWIGGMYGSAGVYFTKDGGATFSSTCFAHTESFSVDVTDPAHKAMLAADHGGAFAMSVDGGVTCTDAMGALKAADGGVTRVDGPYVIDSSTFLVSTGGFNGTDGIFRTTNGGVSWTKVSGQTASQHLLVAGDGTMVYGLYWDRGVIYSKDKGATFLQGIGYGTLDGRPGSADGTFIGDGRLVWIKKRTDSGDQQLMVSSDYTKFVDFLGPFPAVQMTVGDQCLGVVYSKASSSLYTWTRNGKISRWDLVAAP